MAQNKKLIRGKDRMVMGVCSGMAEYMKIDVTVIRLAWVLGTAVTGFVPGIIAYVIAALIIPEQS